MSGVFGPLRRSGARLAVFGLAVAVAATACHKKSPEEESGAGINSSEFKSGDGSKSGESSQPERVKELATVYFDYDSSDIRADARPTLKSNGQAIQAHSEWKLITLEGFCDERGSAEYNLGLGERRGNVAKQYLADLGVPASRMKVVSFGSADPAVQGHDESAWRWNRRVEFRVSR